MRKYRLSSQSSTERCRMGSRSSSAAARKMRAGRARFTPPMLASVPLAGQDGGRLEGSMKRLGLAFLTVMALTGAARAQQINDDPTGPQPTLPTQPLSITADNGTVYNFTVELASTPQEQAYGLMFRPSLAADTGM